MPMDPEGFVRLVASLQTRDELDARDKSLPELPREFELNMDSRVLDFTIRRARKIRDDLS